jgi:SsrA-binding protein
MADAYVKIINGQAFLLNVHIASYDHGNRFNHNTKRQRRLLFHKREILKLHQKIQEKGLTLVPLKFYLKGSLVKVEIGICKGKTYSDKRDTLRQRQDKMDAMKAMRSFNS